jgi:hypothetical protein
MEPPSAPFRRKVLLVLGMHRSGTSATAGLLARLGAGTPATPMPANRHNPRGYGESDVLFRLHDRLLAEAGSAWHDWGPLDACRLTAAGGAGGARAALADAFAAEFGTGAKAPGLAVLKDPRICRFLPLWQAALADLGAATLAVLPLRHPREVADSLAGRDGIAEEEALLLWLRHALEAEAGSRALPRVLFRYEDLVADWRAVATRIAATLAVAWPVPPGEAAPAVEAFLRRDLRHHAADPDAVLPVWVAEGWAALSALERGDAAALPRLDALRAALDAGDALMGAAARRQRRRAAEAEGEAASASGDLARAREAIRGLTAGAPAAAVVAAIAGSHLFEPGWYAARVPGLAGSGIDPARHYALFGSVLGLDPGPEFDAAWYLAHHPDVAAAGVNPLAHYEMHGRGEGRAIRSRAPG